ncbi:MAG: hypothetical protein AAF716_12875 [Cyanobacteria bacterium P01_D01_bin.1]
MVFATASAPSALPHQDLSNPRSLQHSPIHQSNAASLSPTRQTNQLIARAAQARRASEPTMIERRVVNNTETAEYSGSAIPLKVVENSGSAENTLLVLPTALPARRVQKSDLVDQSILAPIELPKRARLPLGLRLLHRVQQGSTVLTGLLVASALLVYGSSVYLDRSTNQAMAQLNALQSESQQLTTANESIKQSLAEQAIKEDSGLKPYQPEDMLFIKPEPRRATAAETEAGESEQLRPLGY